MNWNERLRVAFVRAFVSVSSVAQFELRRIGRDDLAVPLGVPESMMYEFVRYREQLVPDSTDLSASLYRLTCQVRLEIQKTWAAASLQELLSFFVGVLQSLPLQSFTPELRETCQRLSGTWPELTTLFSLAESGDDFDLVYSTIAINPLGGEHPMPSSRAEMSAAMRAVERWAAHFPEIWTKAGVTGQGFVRSDACWIVANAALPVESLKAELRWLREFLSRTRLPLNTMVPFFEFLCDELQRGVPELSLRWQTMRDLGVAEFSADGT